MTFGFTLKQETTTNGLGRTNLMDIASELLSAVVEIRPIGRSLIFVAYSFGGLLVKEALRLADHGQSFATKDVINFTLQIVFMGTPHRSDGDAKSLRESTEKALAVIGRLDPKLQEPLSVFFDERLEFSQAAFLSLWMLHSFRFKSFSEGLVTGEGWPVLSKTAASFEHSDDKHDIIPADHISLCVFQSQLAEGYRKLIVELQGAVRLIRSHRLHLRNQCLESLHFPELEYREHNITPTLESTADWLFRNPDFHRWSQWHLMPTKTQHGLLWIKGKPGSGKSTLMKECLRRAKQLGLIKSISVAGFFFTTRGNIQLQKTPLGLFRTILFDLLQQDRVLLSAFISKYIEKGSTFPGTWQWHQEELQQFLRLAYTGRIEGVRNTILFLDALDECDENDQDVVRDLIYYFQELCSSSKLKVCLSSRHYPHIQVLDCPQIVVEAFNSQDILHFVKTKLCPAGQDRRAR
ncbi:hypothetical protein EV356DRAFT_118743 [Viridothelium virens]|uniref:Nephrocystin 3-like N-terminal domain-containing protein n=1 Tax=Viridothelium virens TaxID=1048519 RepID=A0A6A6HC89_VIRVR|nr:hypothetical protein EV356DRAFT_118743 [Viridothelium virens]